MLSGLPIPLQSGQLGRGETARDNRQNTGEAVFRGARAVQQKQIRAEKALTIQGNRIKQ
jgi:hypothetical protein